MTTAARAFVLPPLFRQDRPRHMALDDGSIAELTIGVSAEALEPACDHRAAVLAAHGHQRNPRSKPLRSDRRGLVGGGAVAELSAVVEAPAKRAARGGGGAEVERGCGGG